MRQADTKDRNDKKEEKRKILVDSSQWTLLPKDKFGEMEPSPHTTEENTLGFSDILDVIPSSSATQNGRRGYGKFANQSESEEEEEDEGEDDNETEKKSTPKRKKPSQKDASEESEDPEEQAKKDKASFKILRQMKSISNTSNTSTGHSYKKKSRTK